MTEIQLNRSDGWIILVDSEGEVDTRVHLYPPAYRPRTNKLQMIHAFADASRAEADMKAIGLAQYLQQAPQAILDHIYVQARSDGVVTMSTEAE